MKITDIKAYAFWAGMRNICLVKVETDEGIYGWGESGLSGREQAVIGAIAHYKEFLVGKDAFQTGAIWQELYRSQYFEGGRVLAAAIAAIDIALHDIQGKALNVPVYQLLGGKQRNKIPLFATSILGFSDALIDDLVSLKNDGWQALRVTTGVHGSPDQTTVFDPRKSIAEAVPYLNKAREVLGSEVVLGIDYHHRLTVAETVSLCQKLNRDVLDFIEEPIRDESPIAYQALRSMVDVPFAIGEEMTSKWDFAPYIESGLANFARIDICNAGGFTEGMKIAAMCETKYIDMMPHNPLSPLCTAASIHYCAAINNLSWLEHLPYTKVEDFDAFFVNRDVVNNGYFDVRNAPGLGIDVNEEALQGLPFRPWEPPRLAKPDGSYTNW